MSGLPEDPAALRAVLRDFYDAYQANNPQSRPSTLILNDIEALTPIFSRYDALDEVRLEEWPDFFTDVCLYRVIPRENFEAGYTLCTMQAESRGMLLDRVTGLRKTQMYAPRYYRRFPGPLRVVGRAGDAIRVRHNLLMVQTMIDKQSDIVLCGTCHDRVVMDGDRVRLAERIVSFDSEMVPNSLIYPA